MNKVRVITGYVPLSVHHMDKRQFRWHLEELRKAIYPSDLEVWEADYDTCWLAKHKPPMVGANPRAEDRFKTDEEHARNNVVCCQFVDWAHRTAVAWAAGTPDVVVALTATVMKQGAFTGKPVKAQHIQAFLRKVENYNFSDIPFPGITNHVGPVDPAGHCWRFCGSTHIWPVKWLAHIERIFKAKTLAFIAKHGKTPLDLQIWPEVERCAGLPYRFYQAEYDATQFTNFPGN